MNEEGQFEPPVSPATEASQPTSGEGDSSIDQPKSKEIESGISLNLTVGQAKELLDTVETKLLQISAYANQGKPPFAEQALELRNVAKKLSELLGKQYDETSSQAMGL